MEVYESIKKVTKSNGVVKHVKMWEMSKSSFKKFKWISFGLGVIIGVDLGIGIENYLKEDELKETYEKGVKNGELKGYMDATIDGIKRDLKKKSEEVDDTEEE